MTSRGDTNFCTQRRHKRKLFTYPLTFNWETKMHRERKFAEDFLNLYFLFFFILCNITNSYKLLTVQCYGYGSTSLAQREKRQRRRLSEC